ncbi:MAG: methylated-DNA--[protein]-cysteine S-methyltransferase [Planctomycetota bacterium]
MDEDLNVVSAAVVETAIGPMLIAASTAGVRWIEFHDDASHLESSLRKRFPKTADRGESDVNESLSCWIRSIQESLVDPKAAIDIPLDIQGTPFQQQVWKALVQIPMGATLTYAELARQIGRPTATRAVASACASNDLAIAIPCHRVIRSDGGLGGYRWGIDRKATLLEREQSAA